MVIIDSLIAKEGILYRAAVRSLGIVEASEIMFGTMPRESFSTRLRETHTTKAAIGALREVASYEIFRRHLPNRLIVKVDGRERTLLRTPIDIHDGLARRREDVRRPFIHNTDNKRVIFRERALMQNFIRVNEAQSPIAVVNGIFGNTLQQGASVRPIHFNLQGNANLLIAPIRQLLCLHIRHSTHLPQKFN